MKKMTFAELFKLFTEHETTNPKEHLKAGIVYTKDSFTKPYPLKSRTYVISSDNKRFQPGKIGNSIFGSCLDGTDQGVRLDLYFGEWKVEYCYLMK